MTSLRKIMLEEFQRRSYSAITTRNYLRVVSEFARHFGKSPDKLNTISGTSDREHASTDSRMASECWRKPVKE